KVLASGDVDPPRPPDALGVETAPMAVAAAAVAPLATPPAEPEPVPVPVPVPEFGSHAAAIPEAAVPDRSEPVESPWHDDAHEAQSRAASEDLEAELAALLAAAEPLPDEAAAPSPPRQELPMHDGDFSYAMSRDDELREVPVEPVAPVVVAKAPA